MMRHQEARLAKKTELKEKVEQILNKQLEEGIIEEVPEEGNKGGQIHYVPWHTVIREWHETTPIRIVYNLSYQDKLGLSLNSFQTAGPNLLPDTVQCTTSSLVQNQEDWLHYGCSQDVSSYPHYS